MTATMLPSIFRHTAAELADLRNALFSRTLDHVFAAHPYYQRAFAAAGLKRADIRTLDDLTRLPITTKQDYMAQPEDFRLRDAVAANSDEAVVWDVMYTTGSSGSPTPFVSTTYDFVNILAVNQNMLRLRGVTDRDSILNLFPLTRYPHGAFIRVLHAASACNIPVISTMPGRANARRPELYHNDDEVIAIAERSRPTILWGVPSYIRKLLGRAQELGVRLPSVRLVFVTGEGFGEEARADLIDRLKSVGAVTPRVSISYGATELQGGMVECAHGSGYHNPAPDQFLFETVEPGTKQPISDDRTGLILLTHLDRRGTVMLRYSLGDVARLSRGRCPHCGAMTERIVSVPRRIDDLVKVKGMLVNPQSLVAAISNVPSLLSFQAIVDKEDIADPLSMDRLRLRVAVTATAPAELDAELARRVQRAIGVTPIVERAPANDPLLTGDSWKTKPLLDLRK